MKVDNAKVVVRLGTTIAVRSAEPRNEAIPEPLASVAERIEL